MAKNTPIEWTDHSWPVLNGCRRKSEGCRNCYAERLIATRLRHTAKYKGLAIYTEGGPRFTGESRLWIPDLAMPIKLRKPARIFVADMGDLFFEGNSNEEIAAVFGVMAACPRHTFQVLTKRPERAAEWFKWLGDAGLDRVACAADDALAALPRSKRALLFAPGRGATAWPLPHVHLGVSCENQDAWKRLAILVHQCPAAVHWASCEPLLGPIKIGGTGAIHLGWLVLGSESGPGARPMEVDWARSLVDQCVENGIPVFTKQIATGQNGKGGDPATWPAGNWPRQYPEVRA
jgi:protein gp37